MFSPLDLSADTSGLHIDIFLKTVDQRGGCRFQGCNHISEPGCLVKEALEEGKVHQVRYEDYCEMYRELEQKEKRRY